MDNISQCELSEPRPYSGNETYPSGTGCARKCTMCVPSHDLVMMTGPAIILFVIILGAQLAEGYAQSEVGKCCSDCDCQGYSLAGGVWTKESCCQSGNPCWCDQNRRCQPSCSSSSQQAQLGSCYSTKNCLHYSRAGGQWTKSDCCSSRGLCWCDQKE